jgi:hypothetical protein
VNSKHIEQYVKQRYIYIYIYIYMRKTVESEGRQGVKFLAYDENQQVQSTGKKEKIYEIWLLRKRRNFQTR